ncbi:hypothetical protein BJ508DRAFT_417618 [Ascobolus immersus RN42]|uniref:Uncharacterized protein n=1 Tax=Ascobolus immersus RN42 TaxID=1160509 RepID=A0A3N4HWH4_ASCIM|nr:hypothetical protein BJ508DRAFT_417618 [Ascobolus immersus RN42]
MESPGFHRGIEPAEGCAGIRNWYLTHSRLPAALELPGETVRSTNESKSARRNLLGRDAAFHHPPPVALLECGFSRVLHEGNGRAGKSNRNYEDDPPWMTLPISSYRLFTGYQVTAQSKYSPFSFYQDNASSEPSGSPTTFVTTRSPLAHFDP